MARACCRWLAPSIVELMRRTPTKTRRRSAATEARGTARRSRRQRGGGRPLSKAQRPHADE